MAQKVEYSKSPDVMMIIQLLLSYVKEEKLRVERDLLSLSYRLESKKFISRNESLEDLKKKADFFDNINFSLIDGLDNKVKNISHMGYFIQNVPLNITPNFFTTKDGTSYFYILTSLNIRTDQGLINKDNERFLRDMEIFFLNLYVRLIKISDDNTPNIYILGFPGKIINNMWVVNRETFQDREERILKERQKQTFY